MKLNRNFINEILSPFRQYFEQDSFERENVNKKPPLRYELLSLSQLEQHAALLAQSHELSHKPTEEQLLKRLSENEQVILKVLDLLHTASREGKTINPAGDWLLDNFYLIEEQLRLAKRHLPKGYSKGLPKLKTGKSAGMPRVYDIALEIISHSDGHVNSDNLHVFISAYQSVAELTLGELWAIPIMLRLALIENLRRIAARLAVDTADVDLADEWADKIIHQAENNPKDLILILGDMARANPPMVSAFVAKFVRRLQLKGLDFSLPISWLEQHLTDTGYNLSSIVLAENQKQAADQVSMSNSISSLRFLTKTDWRDFVELMSTVEETLRTDLNGVYAEMDFHTRDSYRHEVENISKHSRLSENEVARLAITLAHEAAADPDTPERKRHVGYYLTGDGLRTLEKMAKVHFKLHESIHRTVLSAPYPLYVISAIVLTLAITAVILGQVPAYFSPAWLAVGTFLALVAASHLAISLVNWVSTLLIKPKPLPKMDFSKGIPDSCRTLVAVPTIIANTEQVAKLLEDLEVRFLSNRDPNLMYALLTDFTDAARPTVPQDEVLIAALTSGIHELNLKYGSTSNSIFFLFHRSRQWNAKDKIWMGYERKRGKLAALNRVLRGNDKDHFSLILGNKSLFEGIRYVITLDSDTQFPRDAGRKLVGMMAHPLNRAVYNEKKKRITEGYGIIQPRLAISLHGATRSLYSKMHENDAGIDPYTRVISDIYQDVFGEGSFIGKGIYDIDAFEKVTHDRFPDNRILSHDLLEGAYARSGFASDVQFYEDHPSAYKSDAARRHRWIRGDWQIGAWTMPIVPSQLKKWEKNPLSALSRWKIADNLRRSILPAVFLLLLLLGWTILNNPIFWTVAVLLIILLPSLVISCWSLLHKPKEVSFGQHAWVVVRNTSKNIIQSLFNLAVLPYEAYMNLDAIVRTLWRMNISGTKLLEWNPSGFDKSNAVGVGSSYREMWPAPLLACITGYYLISNNSAALWMATPLLLLWAAAPVIVWWVSVPIPVFDKKLTKGRQNSLRELSRTTWAFFEDMVGPADNWLPPDNLQLYPIPVIAHRTSPTNIGLSILSGLAAKDFGYITTGELLDRTERTFETLGKMERYAGHFYNWYDTQTLVPLHPKYISTVDSGNLAGHLLTFRQGLLELPKQKLMDDRLWEGIYDTLRVLLQKTTPKQSTALTAFSNELDYILSYVPGALDSGKKHLEKLADGVATARENVTFEGESEDWLNRLHNMITAALSEINILAPWLSLPELPKTIADKNRWTKNFTLEELARLPLSDAGIPPLPAGLFDGAVIHAQERLRQIRRLADLSQILADMEYDFLYDRTQHLLTIGYNADHNRRDDSFYDLLASEARLSSFVAIAQGKLPQENWFALGRRLTSAGNMPVLLSWSGSMFEFLMPNLVMPSYENTLLDTTNKGCVKRQIEYGRQQNIPWGISESCYNVVDSHLTYQYRAFGVPGLGFKRGLGTDLVIAPYATVLALMVDPEAASHNLDELRRLGFYGKYGYYEAVDYTPARLPRDKSKIIIQCFMAHHQGMSFLSLASVLLNGPMQRRFTEDTQFKTALLLLQERIPKSTGYYSATAESEDINLQAYNPETRIFTSANTPSPEVQLLSNGNYHVMITNAGSGYSRWKNLAVNRWREDTTADSWGTYCYIRNVKSGKYLSAAHHPTLKETSDYTVVFSEGRAEFTRIDDDIETYTEIIVSPEDDIEIRRSKITNRSGSTVIIEVTGYSEVVMASAMADESHPAFSNLFVQTEILWDRNAILCSRRPRSDEEHPPWMAHLMKVTGGGNHKVSYETDRNKFIGRGNTLQNPAAMTTQGPLTNSEGSVLDPIVSVRYSFKLAPNSTATVDMMTGVGDNRDTANLLIDKYQDRQMRDRAFELSFTHSQVVLRQINATEADAQLYNRLAGPMIYANPMLRANQATLIKNQKGQSSLWSYSISGDLPIILLQISDITKIDLVKQLIQARSYWQSKGLVADLVIINEDPSGYRQVLQDQINGLIATGVRVNTGDKQGGIFVRSADQIPAEDYVLMQTVARVIISDQKGTLTDQLNKRNFSKPNLPKLVPYKKPSFATGEVTLPADLKLFNGLGGFTPDGKEYIIGTGTNRRTPLPWSNVIANKKFGTIVTESGSSYTWFENAHSYRLTPWHNDPVKDTNGEALYIRDEETGEFWSPSPLPATGKTPYITRHGYGYTVFEHQEDGIFTQLHVYVDAEESVKFMVLKVKNESGRFRKLSATGYVEWVLGSIRSRTGMYTVCEKDPGNGALYARNSYNVEFPHQVSFLHTDEPVFNFTTDRTEFIGRNGTLARPQGLRNIRLSDKTGAGADACAAIMVPFDLESGSEREITFKLGAGANLQEARHIINKFKGRQTATDAKQNVHSFWNHTLGAIRITTPDAAVNLLSNGWLMYQVLSCRLWGRSGFYQSGGAFGFRDQLQDVMSLIHADPSLTRKQILLNASRQFPEGDVQHWWHPPLGRGVRTLCSDDYLWLPFSVSRYVSVTGDTGVLDEQVSFIEGRKLNVDEESYYDLPVISAQNADLYEHCKRSIVHGLRFGEHGLPLIGSGDWNDGMNMVGIHGKGESVWLAWFLYDVLTRFTKIALLRGDADFAETCTAQAARLKENINLHAWDGNWFVRAYFDDGTPLGSSQNTECRIDSISQSWSVLSEAGDPERSLKAMDSVNNHLVNRQKNLIQLLDPPFDKSDPDPGYIRGYVPGVRENGGQYTHAAIWTVMAFAKLGDHERTWELLNLINPLNHARSEADMINYKVEPYVMAADVYGVAPHTGRGGWTWYTGSAGWMYTLIIESFLGLTREGDVLYFRPCVPVHWNSFTVEYRYHSTVYRIELSVTDGEPSVTVDGVPGEGGKIILKDDLNTHTVKLTYRKK